MKYVKIFVDSILLGLSLVGFSAYLMTYFTVNPSYYWIPYVAFIPSIGIVIIINNKSKSLKWSILFFGLALFGFALGEIALSKINFG